MTTLTITPRHFAARPARHASSSSARSSRTAVPTTLRAAELKHAFSRCLDRWENEGGTWRDEHFIETHL